MRKVGRVAKLLVAVSMLPVVNSNATESTPLKLVDTFSLPGVKKGFDHFEVDVEGNRLFVCTEWHNAVEVYELKTTKHIHSIKGLARPHGTFYRSDLNRIYIVDGTEEMGAVRIVDGTTYELLKTVPLAPDADWIRYDPVSKYLYVTQGGDVLKHSYSMISVVDTTAGTKIADIKVEGDVIEDIALDDDGTKMYLGNKTKNEVDVIDRKTRQVVAAWPMKLGSAVAPLALDQKHHRLFLGCRSGQIVVFDTETGRELQALPISPGVDDLTYDPEQQRLYANCGGPKEGGVGSLDIYDQVDADHYKQVAVVPTGPGARNGILVKSEGRYFVGVPQHDAADASVLVFQLQ